MNCAYLCDDMRRPSAVFGDVGIQQGIHTYAIEDLVLKKACTAIHIPNKMGSPIRYPSASLSRHRRMECNLQTNYHFCTYCYLVEDLRQVLGYLP